MFPLKFSLSKLNAIAFESLSRIAIAHTLKEKTQRTFLFYLAVVITFGDGRVAPPVESASNYMPGSRGHECRLKRSTSAVSRFAGDPFWRQDPNGAELEKRGIAGVLRKSLRTI